MAMTKRVAVLGAGIMGSSTALFLARQGAEVVLYDQADAPFSGASRWNEGKIHLGFLYAGDPSLRTANRLLAGGLAFRPLLEELLECPLENITNADDAVLVHRDSVVRLDDVRSYFHALVDLVRSEHGHSDYLGDLTGFELVELGTTEISSLANPDVVAGGFMVPERSISTNWVADRFVEKLVASPGVQTRTGMRVIGVEPTPDESWRIRTVEGEHGPFDAVVNALWEGRPAVDASVGLHPRYPWTHRYRLSLFVRTRQPVDAPSVLLSVGPFGDIKNYNDRDFYLSWYPTGLLATGGAIEPPTVPLLSQTYRAAITGEIFERLERVFPAVGEIREQAESVRLSGGWVFATGQGELIEPTSTLHQRDRIGIERVGSYFSVDTGKYSVAPWLARQVAESIVS